MRYQIPEPRKDRYQQRRRSRIVDFLCKAGTHKEVCRQLDEVLRRRKDYLDHMKEMLDKINEMEQQDNDDHGSDTI